MLFPIIRVKDGEHIHIVGTNSHDQLYVDEITGGIHYLNLQCCEGTEKIDGEASMEFIAKEPDEWDIHPKIEFVTLEELIKIATENMIEQTEQQVALHNAMSKFLEAKGLCEEKLKDDSIKDTSGRIIF